MQVLRKSTGAEEESKDHGTVSKNQQKGLSQTNLKWFLIGIVHVSCHPIFGFPYHSPPLVSNCNLFFNSTAIHGENAI